MSRGHVLCGADNAVERRADTLGVECGTQAKVCELDMHQRHAWVAEGSELNLGPSGTGPRVAALRGSNGLSSSLRAKGAAVREREVASSRGQQLYRSRPAS